MILGQGAFIYAPDGPKASTGDKRLEEHSEIDLILAVSGNRARMFVDGELVLQTDVELEPSRIGLGIVGGGAEFSEFSVREL